MPRYTQRQQEEYTRFLDKLSAASDDELLEMCKKYIWMSAYARYNLNSNYHRMVNSCYDECEKRGRLDIYATAYDYNLNESLEITNEAYSHLSGRNSI